jgi:hypothetical protein
VIDFVLSLLGNIARILYNARIEQTNYINVQVRKDTRHQLKILAALLDESMLDTLERLVTQELERVQKGDSRATQQKDQAPRD